MSESPPVQSAPSGPASAATGLPPWVWWLALAVGAGIAYQGRNLFIPLLLASVAAYFLNPLVLRLQARGVARGVAVTLLFAVFVMILVATIALVLPTLRIEAQQLVDEAPAFTGKIESALDDMVHELSASRPALARFLPTHAAPGWLLEAIEQQSGEATALLGQAGTVLLLLILAPVFTFFQLRDGPGVIEWIIGRIHPRHIETSVAVWAEVDHIVGQYLRGLVMESVSVGLLAGLGLWFLGIPFPLLIAAFTAIVNPLPYIGAATSLGIAIMVALTSQMGLGTVGGLVVLFAVIRLLDDLVVVPATIGGSVHLHPMLVIVSILVGEQALGLLGMVLAVPTVTVVKEMTRLLLEHQRTLSRRGFAWADRTASQHLPL